MRLSRGRLLLEEDDVMPDVHVVHQHDDPSSPEDPEDGDHDEDAGEEDVQERSSKEYRPHNDMPSPLTPTSRSCCTGSEQGDPIA